MSNSNLKSDPRSVKLEDIGASLLNPATEETLQLISNNSSAYKVSDLDSGTTSYFGYVKPDGTWYILKLTDTEARYVKGTTNYTTAWTGRAGLTYTYYNLA